MPSRYGIRSRQFFALGRGQRRGDHLEVDGVVGVGEDEELVAAVGDRILHAFLARRDEARRRFGIGQIDQALLGGFVVAAGDHAEAAAGALMQMGEPAGILFFINQNVVRLPGPQAMAPDLHRAVIVVELDVEEAFAVQAPDHAAIGLLDEIVEIGATGPVAHANGKIFRAFCVSAPGMQPVIGRMPRAAEPEIFVARRKRVAVQHDIDLAAVARRAAEQFMLPALAEFPQIGERAVRRRHAGIVFLDPPAHFRDQLLLQRRGVAEQALGVVVLGFEIFPDVRIQDRRIAQHLLPFLVLQPRIVVASP